jgi:hypothetical protein
MSFVSAEQPRVVETLERSRVKRYAYGRTARKRMSLSIGPSVERPRRHIGYHIMQSLEVEMLGKPALGRVAPRARPRGRGRKYSIQG